MNNTTNKTLTECKANLPVDRVLNAVDRYHLMEPERAKFETDPDTLAIVYGAIMQTYVERVAAERILQGFAVDCDQRDREHRRQGKGYYVAIREKAQVMEHYKDHHSYGELELARDTSDGRAILRWRPDRIEKLRIRDGGVMWLMCETDFESEAEDDRIRNGWERKNRGRTLERLVCERWTHFEKVEPERIWYEVPDLYSPIAKRVQAKAEGATILHIEDLYDFDGR